LGSPTPLFFIRRDEMTIIIFLIITILASIILGVYSFEKKQSRLSEFFSFLFVALTATLLVSLVLLPIKQSSIRSEIAEFLATKNSVESARLDKNLAYESIMITKEIIEANKWLAKRQYWNETLFDIWIPDKVMELKPIK
jgi:hypothetical protein